MSQTILRLFVPPVEINRTRLAKADIVIDQDDNIYKHPDSSQVGRRATPQEFEQSVEVYG